MTEERTERATQEEPEVSEGEQQPAPPAASVVPETPRLFPEPPPGRPPGAEEEPEPADEEERHPVAAILSAMVILAALGVSAFLLIRPLPCDRADFSSPTLGYCVDLPTGWTATADDGQGQAADHFTQNQGVAAITVQAVDVPSGANLDTIAQQIKTVDQNAGFAVSDTRITDVGGSPAQTWVATSGGGASVGTTETVVLKDGSAWRITFSDVDPPPANDDSSFRGVLGSWHFK